MEPFITVFGKRRRAGNDYVYMLGIAGLLAEGKTVIIPVMGEEHANKMRERLKAHKIECEITEGWDPTKEGLSSHGHMTHVYDELTGEVYKTKWADEPPTLRCLNLKPKT
jgi:hypothetical protein